MRKRSPRPRISPLAFKVRTARRYGQSGNVRGQTLEAYKRNAARASARRQSHWTSEYREVINA